MELQYRNSTALNVKNNTGKINTTAENKIKVAHQKFKKFLYSRCRLIIKDRFFKHSNLAILAFFPHNPNRTHFRGAILEQKMNFPYSSPIWTISNKNKKKKRKKQFHFLTLQNDSSWKVKMSFNSEIAIWKTAQKVCWNWIPGHHTPRLNKRSH